MGMTPGVGETGAGASVVKVAAKVVKEAVKGMAEMAKKTPDKMVAVARKPLSNPNLKPTGEMSVMAKPAEAARGVLGSESMPEAPVISEIVASKASSVAKVESATKEQAGAKIDATKKTEVTNELSKMISSNNSKQKEGAGVVNKDTNKSSEKAVSNAGTENTSHAQQQQTTGEKPQKPSLRSRWSKEYKQAMERSQAAAIKKGDDIKDPKVQAEIRKRASDEFYRARAAKTPLTEEIKNDQVYESAYEEALNDATAKYTQNGEKTGSEAIQANAMAKYLEVLDKAPIREKVKRFVKKYGKSFLYMLLALVGGAVFATAKEGTEPSLQPNKG